jgi:hypothetical protein
MVRVESLSECRVNWDGSQLISVNVFEYVVPGVNLIGTTLQIISFCSPWLVDDCITTLTPSNIPSNPLAGETSNIPSNPLAARETEQQAIFLAILWLENYEREAQWAMHDCRSEWDPKVSELLDRLFR